MSKSNRHLLNTLLTSSLPIIEEKVALEKRQNSHRSILFLGACDTTKPIPIGVHDAICQAVQELTDEKTFKGYGPIQGYEFLRNAIQENEYAHLKIDPDEIFISDGAKTDCANIQQVFSQDCQVGVFDPTYPVYMDANILAGRDVTPILCLEENRFHPVVPTKHFDLVYLCSPNNPTGTTLTRQQLLEWVEYAQRQKAVLIFDSAYSAYITDSNIPKSIYEIEGARNVAIEIRTFSKIGGFTGLRASYMVIPKTLFLNQGSVSCHKVWKTVLRATFNGVSYPIQKGAASVYSAINRQEIGRNIQEYLAQTNILKNGLEKMGYVVFGGRNAPFLWCKVPSALSSWQFFDVLLKNAGIVSYPGPLFGSSGEGYVRFAGFATNTTILEALSRMEKL